MVVVCPEAASVSSGPPEADIIVTAPAENTVRLVIHQRARNVNSQAPQLVDMLTEIDDGATV